MGCMRRSAKLLAASDLASLSQLNKSLLSNSPIALSNRIYENKRIIALVHSQLHHSLERSELKRARSPFFDTVGRLSFFSKFIDNINN